jgi:uncharacterized cupredoxin-like copper-binding protein
MSSSPAAKPDTTVSIDLSKPGAREMKILPLAAFLLSVAPIAALAGAGPPGHSHASFSAGEPGNPKKPARVVKITMQETDGKMTFAPERIEVRKGEQIKFVLSNDGELKHEFMLATAAENDKHAVLMQKYPDMEHDDPNGKSLETKKAAELIWKFTKAGEFEFACLIPGHREAGMHGKVIVK